jgi:hypothetical protein
VFVLLLVLCQIGVFYWTAVAESRGRAIPVWLASSKPRPVLRGLSPSQPPLATAEFQLYGRKNSNSAKSPQSVVA